MDNLFGKCSQGAGVGGKEEWESQYKNALLARHGGVCL
jgi:hypothetical protein